MLEIGEYSLWGTCTPQLRLLICDDVAGFCVQVIKVCENGGLYQEEIVSSTYTAGSCTEQPPQSGWELNTCYIHNFCN